MSKSEEEEDDSPEEAVAPLFVLEKVGRGGFVDFSYGCWRC
jgi:hypothetical protein